MKRLIYLALIVLMIAAVYCLNHWCPPVHDELAYTFQGECTPIEADAHHVQNIGDVVKIQIDDYRHGPNGRVFLHSIVTLFSGWELYGLFDVANTGVWFLLCWLVLRAGHSELETSKKWCAGIAFVTFFFWTGEIGCMNSAFCVNYLWSSCLTVLMIQCWRKCESVWMVPLCFLYGWWQEVFSMPMAAALFSCGLIEWMRKKEFLWSNRRCWAWGMMLIGGAGCCGSHLLSGRAARSCLNGVGGMIVELIKAQVKCAMFVWPLVLVCCVLFVLWTHRKRFVALYDAAPEWWMYFLWSMGVWVVLGNEGLRMACPCLLAGVILLVQNRGVFRRFEKMILPAACAVVMWMIMAASIQYRIGKNEKEMERIYAMDSQGVTYRRTTSPGPLLCSVALEIFNRWHLGLFKHKYRHRTVPVVLSPWLYESLYLDSRKFFSCAYEPYNNVYACSNEYKYVVHRGWPDDIAKKRAEEYLIWRNTPVGMRKYLPGRIETMFPSSDFYFSLPSNHFPIVTKDGAFCVITTLK